MQPAAAQARAPVLRRARSFLQAIVEALSGDADCGTARDGIVAWVFLLRALALGRESSQAKVIRE